MKTGYFIINPHSGQQIIQSKLKEIIGQLILDRFINRAECVYTKKDRTIDDVVDLKKIRKFDFIVAVGGDGTINQVVDYIARHDIEVPLVILGAGTVNDFASFVKIPRTPAKIVKMIEDFHTIKSDIGKINDSHFINVVAGGMFADVSYVTSTSDKKILGPLSYTINAITNLQDHLSRLIPLKVKVDSQEFTVDARMFLIANSKHIGGFNRMVPYASIQDGKLDLQILKNCNAVELVQFTTELLFGNHVNTPKVEYYQGSCIEISSDINDVFVDIDGEKGPHLPIRIEALKQKLTIIVPKE